MVNFGGKGVNQKLLETSMKLHFLSLPFFIDRVESPFETDVSIRGFSIQALHFVIFNNIVKNGGSFLGEMFR